jgi:hypothetical protein
MRFSSGGVARVDGQVCISLVRLTSARRFS